MWMARSEDALRTPPRTEAGMHTHTQAVRTCCSSSGWASASAAERLRASRAAAKAASVGANTVPLKAGSDRAVARPAACASDQGVPGGASEHSEASNPLKC